ncbi:hypothetical protein [Streptosporangium lutulentum]|uniref:Collagen triple helix repeat-containing protein n=1 Tax=Streptosporangium lutulentum TaxID=1461250 RepID=A0ABT9QPZ3_9ACTN|nr:hypothetical protein [Streptosporangium lutulentum]MDP9848480.1 hypothetical protein [Streptosporangium lutulentum]
MRLVVGMGAVIALLIGQSPVAGVSDTPAAVVRKVAADPDPSKKNVNVNNSTTSGKDDGSSGKGGSSGKSGSSGKNGGQIPPELKNVTSLRVLPWNPRQNNNVRIFVHCPPTSNHAIIGSTAFNLKGSRRIYREVGLGLSDRGLGRRSAGISYFALLGDHEVCLTCVKVTMNQQTRLRKIRVTGRDSVPLLVRRFRFEQFFNWD